MYSLTIILLYGFIYLTFIYLLFMKFDMKKEIEHFIILRGIRNILSPCGSCICIGIQLRD